MGILEHEGSDERPSFVDWWRQLSGGSQRRTKPARRHAVGQFAGAVQTLETRSMMAADLGISPIWFQDVAGSDFERQGGSYGVDADGVTQYTSANPHVTDWIVQLSYDVASQLTSVAQVSSLLAGSDMSVEVVRGLGLVGQLLVRSEGATADEVEQWFSSLDVISSFEQDIASVFHITPNDGNYSQTWGMDQIDAPAAWDKTTGSNSVVVGVIDTGVDWSHPDLKDNMWVNPGEIPGNGIDDDGNGFVDDVYGYDFVNNDGNPMDDNHHGTHVAGTIAAQGNNGRGVAGVAWNTSIMALKFLSANGTGYTSDAVRAINYATMMRTQYDVNIRVLNNSWGGGGYSASLDAAIKASEAADILFVAAAGNSGINNDSIPHYPSNYTAGNVISVAATDRNDNLASFSNYGQSTVDIAAPGVGIYSTIAGGYYASFSGTSMAAPHVAGVAALAFAFDPDATAAEVKDAILAGGDQLDSLTGKVLTGSRLNAAGALDLLSPGTPDPEPEPQPQPQPEPEPEPVPNQAPTVGSVSTNPGTIRLGETGNITITANNVADRDGSVAKVAFYLDTNGNGQWDASDQVLGTDSTISGGEASISLNNPFTQIGSFKIFARALDNQGAWSNLVSTTISVIQTDDHGNTAAGSTLIQVGSSNQGKINYTGDVDYFRFSVVAGKTYVIDTSHRSLAGSSMTLYGSNGTTQLDQSSSSGTGSKIVWTADTSGTVYLAVQGATAAQTGDYTLRVSHASPFELQGGKLTIVGTAGNDSLTVQRTGSVLTVTMNGTSTQYNAAQVRQITFDGGAGNDTARFYGTSSRESWVLQGDSMTLNGSGYTWTTINTENNYGHAGQEDNVLLVDTPGNDSLTVSPAKATMVGAGYKNEVYGAASIKATANRGGVDTAMLYDTAGNDFFIGRGKDSYLLGQGYSVTTSGFERTNVYSTGGADQAYMYDTAGDDTFTSYGRSSVLVGPGFSNSVYHFARVTAVAMNGGNDRATFHDTPGNDTYVARGSQSYMYGTGYYAMAQGFANTAAISGNGGNDQAIFYDTPASDTFQSRAAESSMAGNGYQNTARGFQRVETLSTTGDLLAVSLLGSDQEDQRVAQACLPTYDSAEADAYLVQESEKTYVGSLDVLMQYLGE